MTTSDQLEQVYKLVGRPNLEVTHEGPGTAYMMAGSRIQVEPPRGAAFFLEHGKVGYLRLGYDPTSGRYLLTSPINSDKKSRWITSSTILRIEQITSKP